MNGNKGFWDTEGGSEEDADDFTNVGRDQVANELDSTLSSAPEFTKNLFHVVVNGATLLNSGDD